MVTRLKRLPTEWEKNLCQLYIWQGINNQNTQGAQKIEVPTNRWPNELNRLFSKEEAQIAKKTHEEMLNIPGHKGNANQNQVNILPHAC
jgi:hypothetical protein